MKKAMANAPKMEQVLAIPELLEIILLHLADGTSIGTRTLFLCGRVSKYFQAMLEGSKFRLAFYLEPYTNTSNPHGNLLIPPPIPLRTQTSDLPPFASMKSSDSITINGRHRFDIFYHAHAEHSDIWQRIVSFNFTTAYDPMDAIGSWRAMYMHDMDLRVVIVQVVWGQPGKRFRRIVQCDRKGATIGQLLNLACRGTKEVFEIDTTGLEQAARKQSFLPTGTKTLIEWLKRSDGKPSQRRTRDWRTPK